MRALRSNSSTKMVTTTTTRRWTLLIAVIAPILLARSTVVNAVITCPRPGKGPGSPLTPGTTVTIHVAPMDQLCTLVRLTKTTVEGNNIFSAPVGRSYNDRSWESVQGPYTSDITFDCSAGGSTTRSRTYCTTTLPMLDDPTNEEFVLISYSHKISHQEEIARFLEQTTFGPKRSEIAEFKYDSNDNPDFAGWVKHQMDVRRGGLTSHREYFRTRANARVTDLDDETIANGDRPCNVNSRWKRYAFSYEDGRDSFKEVDFYFTIYKAVNDVEGKWFVIKNVKDQIITEVPRSTWGTYFEGIGERFTVCDNTLGEWTKGTLAVQLIDNKDDKNCYGISSGNPMIQFRHVTTPEHVLELPDDDDDSILQEIDTRESKGSDFLLTKSIVSMNDICNQLPREGGDMVHALSSDGKTWYIHDPRIVLKLNTIDSPLMDGGSADSYQRNTTCSNVPRTFLNEQGCRLSMEYSACTPSSHETDFQIPLSEATLKDLHERTSQYIYALEMTEPQFGPCTLFDSDKIDYTKLPRRSRWRKRTDFTTSEMCPTMEGVSETTKKFLHDLIRKDFDQHPTLKDIEFLQKESSNCDATDQHKGMKIWVDDTCWEHVHNDHLNVYDFTDYAVIHGRQTKTDTGASPITKFADREEVYLKYPEDHSINWWKLQKVNDRIPNPIGRFGDFILIDHIPKEMRTETVIQMFEESGYGKGRIVCGSPNEVANNPLLGHEFDIAMNATLDRTLTDLEDYEAQKWSVWNTIALYSNDQLRQRMAFALSQIFAMVPGDIDQAHETESFLNYYDIFVRHAFGKYEDILKEVAYHPMMAEMLTYLESKSSGYAYEVKKLSNVYPDENFAREIMQLFSIGLVKLNMDGTPVIREEDGTIVQTYSNLHIMDNSRAWTGFDRQDLAGRANIELLTPIRNRMDPMKIHPEWRDPMPKASLYHEGYIGDSDVPLCMDLPPSIFLKKGATYRLLGSNKMPDFIEDPKWWNIVNDAERLVVQQGTSSLYAALCSDTDGDGVCEYPITVTLSKTIPCDEHECMIDEPRVVQVGANASPLKIYYEYVRPPCVQFPFYNNALKMKKKLETDKAMCADPRMTVASEACCDNSSNDDGLTGFFEHTKKNCMFPGEKLTYDTAVKRCEEKGWKPCSTRMSTVTNDKYCSGPYNCCIYNEQYHWTNIDCQISIKINPRGEIAVIHSHADRDVVTGKMRGDIHESVQNDNVNFFRVHWRHGSFPSSEGGMCNGSCKVDPTNTDICLCDISVMESQVFTTLPTAERALDMLKIGGVPPKWYNRRECKLLEQSEDVKAWDCTKSGRIDEDTVFEVKRGYYPKYYLKNTHSSVRVNEGVYEFRNPPHFMTLSERNVRDAQYETDAVLRQVIYHPNTPPFMARRIIQRFGISNPSPKYIEAVATAFLTGRYNSGGKTFGSGDYGDLGATCAATLLHDEARSVVLDADPSYGNLREPLLRVMHVMRSLEIVPNLDLYPHIKTISMDKKIGQMAHSIPNVFSFFLPDYIPPGRANAASIYSPEAGVASTPNIIGIMGGLFSLVKYGLSSCDSGFGPKAASCGVGAAQLTYQSPIANNLDAAIEELSLLLTAGRLTKNAKNLIKLTALEGYNFEEQVRIVQQLIMTTPEFHASGVVERTPELRPEPEPPVYSGGGYKNVVFLFLESGFDSFNFMVPDDEKCASMYEMYKNTRGPLALDPEKELTEAYSAAGSQSVCDSWKFHVNATNIAKLFGEKDAIVFSNIGVLLEAGVNKENWESLHRDTVLFAHDKQQDEAKLIDPFHDVSGTGVIGRITDALTTSSNPFKTNSISFGGVKALAGEDGVSPTIKHVNEDGATQFDPRPSTKDVLPTVKKLNNFTTYDSNMFGDFWSNRVVQSLTENHEFHTILGKTTVTTKFTTTLTPRKFQVIAKLIKGHEERGIDRDFFYLSKPGWDVHGAEAKLKTATLLADVDLSLKEFVEELKHQDKWKDTVIVCLSEFGRTLTANSGGGSDHAWGGQAFIAGGSVKGGRILGKYPENYDDYDVSRGRLYPAIPFDSMWNGIATWMGVPGSMMDKVLPNRHKFSRDLYETNDLFDPTIAQTV